MLEWRFTPEECWSGICTRRRGTERSFGRCVSELHGAQFSATGRTPADLRRTNLRSRHPPGDSEGAMYQVNAGGRVAGVAVRTEFVQSQFLKRILCETVHSIGRVAVAEWSGQIEYPVPAGDTEVVGLGEQSTSLARDGGSLQCVSARPALGSLGGPIHRGTSHFVIVPLVAYTHRRVKSGFPAGGASRAHRG